MMSKKLNSACLTCTLLILCILSNISGRRKCFGNSSRRFWIFSELFEKKWLKFNIKFSCRPRTVCGWSGRTNGPSHGRKVFNGWKVAIGGCQLKDEVRRTTSTQIQGLVWLKQYFLNFANLFVSLTRFAVTVDGDVKFHSGFVNSISSAMIREKTMKSSLNENGVSCWEFEWFHQTFDSSFLFRCGRCHLTFYWMKLALSMISITFWGITVLETEHFS